AWVAERKSVLSTLVFMLTILAYVGYARRTSWKRYLTVLGLFSLGLMAKPMLVTLPFILLLLDYWPLGRFMAVRRKGAERDHPVANEEIGDSDLSSNPPYSSRMLARLVVEKAPLLALALGDCIVTVAAQRRMGAIVSLSANPLSVRLENALVSYAKYLEKMVWPAGLAVPYPFSQRIAVWHIAAAGVVLASASAIVIWKRKQYPYLVVGWLWFLGTLVPVIGLVQVGPQAMADRYAYVPLIGVFVMIVWGAAEFKTVPRRAITFVACVAVMIALSVKSSHQTGYWRDDVTLFEHAKNVTYNNSTAFDMLGNVYAREGKFDEAIQEFSKIPAADASYCKAQSSIGMALLQ